MGEIEQAVKSLPSHHELHLGDARNLSMLEPESVDLVVTSPPYFNIKDYENGTGGDVQIAVDAIGSASQPHHFLGVTAQGRSAIVETTGNPYSHVILRGGKQPNYDASSVDDVAEMLANAGLPQRIMIDASHANSRKKPERQADVALDIAHQVGRGDRRIFGMMLESHLVEGKQSGDGELTYGQSITDACMGWERTEGVLHEIAEAVRKRRKAEG